MSKKRKKIAAWRNARAEAPFEEVEALVRHVFGDRVREGSGTSHELHIDVHELKGESVDFQFGSIRIVVKNSRVKPAYLKTAYRAAIMLGLLEEEE